MFHPFTRPQPTVSRKSLYVSLFHLRTCFLSFQAQLSSHA
jgi:hypothetical protein